MKRGRRICVGLWFWAEVCLDDNFCAMAGAFGFGPAGGSRDSVFGEATAWGVVGVGIAFTYVSHLA